MVTALRIAALIITGFFFTLFAQTAPALTAPTAAVVPVDTIHKASAPLIGTITPVAAQKDTVPKKNDTAASASTAPQKPAEKKISLVKRSYSAKQQVLLACGMMIFVVSMFTAAQNWNPK
jgi:hypothetical protein